MLLASTDRDFDIEREAVGTFIAHRADAIVLAGSRQSGDLDRDLEAEFDRYRDNGGRVVVIGQPLASGGAVELENRAGAGQLADALVDAGHTQFAVIGGPGSIRTAVDRRNGFVEALGRRGFTPLVEVSGDFTRDGGYSAARRLAAALELHPDSGATPVCAFAVTDVMAIGAIAAWRELGLCVPRDVCVAGFDDIPTLRDHTPTLSTVILPLEHIGARAVELALRLDAGSDGMRAQVAGDVVLRDSTRLA
jgi:LacI family transcriptional regulator